MLIQLILATSSAYATQNAADLYLKLVPEYEERNKQLELEVDWIQTCLEHGYPITDDMRSTLQSATDQTLRLIYEATSSKQCDFELNFAEDGFELLLPHLMHMQYGNTVLQGEASRAMQFGDHETFSKATVAALKMARDMTSDSCVVSSMVSLSSALRIANRINDAMERGFIRPGEAKQIAEALTKSIEGDAFGIIEAVDNERAMGNTWLPNALGLSDHNTVDHEALQEWLAMCNSVSTEEADPLLLLKNLTASEVRVALQKLDAAHGRIATAVRNPNRKAGIRAVKHLEHEVDEGKWGFISKIMIPAMGKVLQKRDEAIGTLQERIEQLKAIATENELDPRLTNAAWWWIRAGEFASTLGPAWIDDPQLAGEIDVILTTSSAMSNAQYPQPWEYFLEATVPWWLPNQDLLLRGLLERANRSIAQEDATAAVRDLVLCIRMAAALSVDPRIATSLVAAGVVESLAMVLPAAASAGLLDQESRASLDQLLRTIPVRDPVGLQRAFQSTHDRVMDVMDPERIAGITLPDAGPSLLNAVAYLRGWSAAQGPQSPLFYVVPGGSAAHLRLYRLDANLLDAWYELGSQSDQLAGFAELGGIDAEASKKAVPEMIQQARDALRQ
ncbi:MAG: hypothetical protein QF561_05720 [Phycisphaerales bacterium]|jgi:hypothetical protein|nr:hypothetical protein [Phycisphaerales bacterium]